jgi:hypothetical protein
MFKVIKTAEQISAETEQKKRDKRIADLKKFLLDSDYKVLPDYDNSSEEIKVQRQTWRDEIRELEALNNTTEE